MEDNFMNKDSTLIIKGIAIIMMVIHHLFAFPDRVYSGGYSSIYMMNNVPIEYYIGHIGKMCVSMFLFLGGYGTYKVYKEYADYKKIIKKITKLYINYWIIFIIFIPLGIFLGKITIDFKVLFLNFIALSSSINNEWWFFIDYIILIACYPLIIKSIRKNNKYKVVIYSFLVFCIGSISNIIFYKIDIIIFKFISNIMSLQFMFIMGIIVSKYGVYDYINTHIKKGYYDIIMIIMGIFISIIFPIRTLIYPIITPIIIFSLTRMIKQSKVLLYLGKNSNNIWLTHTFFCYYYFKELTFIPKYSILIVIWTLILNLIVSIILNKLSYICEIALKKIIYNSKISMEI